MSSSSHSRVAYFYDPDVGRFYYSSHHPMKPYRLTVTHNLVLNYGLYKKMQVFCPRRATRKDLTSFHSPDYVDFLYSTSRVHLENTLLCQDQLLRFNLIEDCPVFEGMMDFIELYTGASLDAARKIIQGQCDVAINWAGGLHHAHKEHASGFCYVNDLVLCIIELLKFFPRVLYLDVDIHHGDGVQEAFYLTDRVMCISFHKFGNNFFPGTGDINEIGLGPGRYTTINVPLKDGIDDNGYVGLFKPIIQSVMDTYRPSVVVLQCGADSLNLDRLGCFNLTIHGHGECLQFIRSFGLPTLVIGGGGYTVRNVARCWTYETGLICGESLQNTLPYNDYLEYFSPDFSLIPDLSRCVYGNQNSKMYTDFLRQTILENLKALRGAPVVTMQTLPASTYLSDEDYDELIDPDVQGGGVGRNGALNDVVPDTELYDDDHDHERCDAV